MKKNKGLVAGNDSFGGSAGFTLIEILVSLVIVSLCIVLLFSLISGSLNTIRKAELQENAFFRAQAKMDEILLWKELAEMEIEGRVDDNMTWRAEIARLQELERGMMKKFNLGMFDIKVIVNWTGGRNQQSVRLNTIKLSKIKAGD